MAETPTSWLDELASTDAHLHATLEGRREQLSREAWSRRVVEAEAALAQARSTIALQDRLLRDLTHRHVELEAELQAAQGAGDEAGAAGDAATQADSDVPLGAGAPTSRLRVAVTDPVRALRAVRRRLPGGSR